MLFVKDLSGMIHNTIYIESIGVIFRDNKWKIVGKILGKEIVFNEYDYEYMANFSLTKMQKKLNIITCDCSIDTY